MKYLLLFSFMIASFGAMNGQTPYSEDGCLQLKVILKENAKILSEPNERSYERAIAERFTILYVFKGEGSREGLSGDYYYVGKTPGTPQGYLHKDKVSRWNHRLCLAFTDLVGREPALIYKNLTDVEGEDWDFNKRPNDRAIAQEPTAKKDVKYDMLLPVLREKGISQKGRLTEYQNAYKIAFLGGDGNETPPPSLFNQKTRLDLMFLMDATASMGHEIQGAKEAVQAITDKLSRLENTEVRIGIACYKDRTDNYQYREFLKFTKDYKKVASTLAGIHAGGGEDTREAMFEGVQQAILNPNWSKGEQYPLLKVVILIGDASAHDESDAGYAIHIKDLISKASENRVRFIALKVIGGDAADDNRHRVQLRDISQGMVRADAGLYLEAEAYTGSMSDTYVRKLTSSIEAEVERMKELELFRTGAKTMPDITPSNRAIFMKNMPSSGYSDMGIHFNEGWVSKKNDKGQSQVDLFVYMTYKELDLYIWYLITAIKISEVSDDAIKKTMKNQIVAMTGEVLENDENLDDHLRKMICLPSGDSGILKYSLDDISRWSEHRKQSVIKSFESRVEALESIRKDDAAWREATGTSLRYTFVPLSLMP